LSKDEHILWFGTAKHIRESTQIPQMRYSFMLMGPALLLPGSVTATIFFGRLDH